MAIEQRIILNIPVMLLQTLLLNGRAGSTTDLQPFGAIADGFVSAVVARYDYEAGFYVFDLAGHTVNLILPPVGFKPGMW
jgi:hypothetical protein